MVRLAAVQHQLYRVYHDLMLHKDNEADVQALRADAVQAQTQFN